MARAYRGLRDRPRHDLIRAGTAKPDRVAAPYSLHGERISASPRNPHTVTTLRLLVWRLQSAEVTLEGHQLITQAAGARRLPNHIADSNDELTKC